MIGEYWGEIAGVTTAVCWTVTAMSFEAASRRIGPLAVNLIRLIMALFFFVLLFLVTRGTLIPTGGPPHVWFWLSLSGLAGFVLGDLLLFRAFVLIGSRISMLIFASVPPLTAIIGHLVLGEVMSPTGLLGMGLTISGICLVILQRKGEKRGFLLKSSLMGILLAFGGSLGQAIGLVLSKYGAPQFNAFAATQIRAIAGVVGFSLIFTLTRRWGNVVSGLKNGRAIAIITLGAFMGPFIGVSLGLFSAQQTSTGVASTLMSIVPVLIIVPSVILFKERVTAIEVIGAIIAVTGIGCMFL